MKEIDLLTLQSAAVVANRTDNIVNSPTEDGEKRRSVDKLDIKPFENNILKSQTSFIQTSYETQGQGTQHIDRSIEEKNCIISPRGNSNLSEAYKNTYKMATTEL